MVSHGKRHVVGFPYVFQDRRLREIEQWPKHPKPSCIRLVMGNLARTREGEWNSGFWQSWLRAEAYVQLITLAMLKGALEDFSLSGKIMGKSPWTIGEPPMATNRRAASQTTQREWVASRFSRGSAGISHWLRGWHVKNHGSKTTGGVD